ncbi:MAG: Cof-type HAD-IIB family hydrolase [Clostridia bacterium]|nr:Cof-type HAD-IIB family hydrolase [Clostridia bacterium]
MKKLKCKLIVSDFDGTLANSQNEVPDDVVKAINSYISDGGIFAVCTGRILPSILPRVRTLGLKGLVIAGQGSVIADIQTGKLLRDVCFTNAQTAEICAALEELKSNVQVYNNDGFYSDLPEDEKHLNLYESIIGVQANHVETPLSEYVSTSPERFNKVAALCRPEDQEELYSQLLKRFGNKYDVTCSAKVLVEISPYGETKGKAVEFLAQYYSVEIDETCAVGDNLNDLSMILTAGYGVAVGNAAKGLLDRTQYVTVTNDEGAVARVIKDFGYIQND